MFTAYWLNTPRKEVHGGPSLTYGSFSAVAIEQEGYIDAINTPEWGVNQICKSKLNIECQTHFRHIFPFSVLTLGFACTDGPDRDFEWSSTYKFSVVH